MKYFADTVIKPLLIRNGYRHIGEIGTSYGENTDRLLELDSVTVTIVDPCLDIDLRQKYRNNRRVRVYKGASLGVLERISDRFDCILIDGDHNWYTVYNELRIIHKRRRLREHGTIFLHDISWPYGRRDMYYRPELLPGKYVHPYERKGIAYGRSALSNTSRFNANLCNAAHVGGPRNGVLTAIEDFLKTKGASYKFSRVGEEFGLGILLRAGHQIDDMTSEGRTGKSLSRIASPRFSQLNQQ